MNCRCGAPLTQEGICTEVAANRAPRGATHQPATDGFGQPVGKRASRRPAKAVAKKAPAKKVVAKKKAPAKKR